MSILVAIFNFLRIPLESELRGWISLDLLEVD